MKTFIIISLIVLQFGIPLAMIAKYEAVLKLGHEYKFKCAPFDPVDHLRGRYVALRFAAESGLEGSYDGLPHTVWAVLEKDANGFAKIRETALTKPSKGDFVKLNVPRFGGPKLPFDKYFMNESIAPAAEDVYRKRTRDAKSAQDCYLVVKVWRGSATASSLMVGDRPIEDVVREAK